MRKLLRDFILTIGIASIAAGCAVHYAWVSGYQPDEHYTAKTADDWTLSLNRYRPEPGSRVETFPVILCHGLGMNGTVWNLKKGKSLAEYLRQRGFDVWVVDLRGAGRSSKPGWVVLHDLLSGPDLHPMRYENTSFRFDHNNWNLDDHIREDVPTILSKVKEVTGATRVHWVGHSMGGIVILGYLIRTQDPSIAGVVALATSMSMPPPLNDVLKVLGQHADMKQLVYLVNNRMTARFFGVMSSFGGTPMDPLLYNRKNMENDVVGTLMARAIEDLSPGVLEAYIGLIKTGELRATDTDLNYSLSLNKVEVPLLLMGGKSDAMCSTVSLYDTYRGVASHDKTLRIFGLSNGYRADYGHNDLIVGRYATEEVYPYLARWFKERSQRDEDDAKH
jgi:pimeloyl-ACP methyl ester carboxylesterase